MSNQRDTFLMCGDIILNQHFLRSCWHIGVLGLVVFIWNTLYRPSKRECHVLENPLHLMQNESIRVKGNSCRVELGPKARAVEQRTWTCVLSISDLLVFIYVYVCMVVMCVQVSSKARIGCWIHGPPVTGEPPDVTAWIWTRILFTGEASL